jgi:hypothetical protein
MDVSTLLHPSGGQAPTAAWVCTIGVLILWVVVFRSAWKIGEHHTLALVIGTVYCLISEYLAIRLGKYHYAAFPLSIPEFSVPGLEAVLAWGSRFKIIPPMLHVDGVSKHVPLEIALLEGALLYGVFRITNLLSPQRPPGECSLRTLGPWARERWPNPVLNGFLAISLDAMLDPVVSGTMSIDGSGITQAGLGLWTWHTSAHYGGHWFGVPLANYNAWFAALFAFTAAIRVGEHRTVLSGKTVFDRGKLMAGAALRGLGLLIGSLFLVKFALDYVTYEFFGLFGPHTPAGWQFTVALMLLVLGVIGGFRIASRAVRTAAFEAGTVAAIVFVFAYCAGALFAGGATMWTWQVWAVWMVTAVIAGLHAAAPWQRRAQPVNAPPPPAVMV